MLADGYAFSFEVLTKDGIPAPENVRAKSLMIGVTAVLLYIAVSMTTVELVHKDVRRIALRIGKKDAVQHVLLPGIMVRMVLLCIAAVAGLLLAEPITEGFAETGLVAPVLVYSALITVMSLWMTVVWKDSRALYLLLFVV